MKQEILFVLLKDFADWEGAYIAPYLNYGCGPDIESKYVVKKQESLGLEPYSPG